MRLRRQSWNFLGTFRDHMGRLAVSLSLLHLTTAVVVAQPNTKQPAVVTLDSQRAPYLVRGDLVEKRYRTHREHLEQLFNELGERLGTTAPDLRAKLLPPAPVPFGYQILPALMADPPLRAGPSRIALSPFSWSRTDTIIDRNDAQVAALEARLEKTSPLAGDERRREYEAIVDEYLKLVAGQKFIENLIQYNRLWQGDIARRPQIYRDAKILQDAALERQALLDSMRLVDEPSRARMGARADSLFSRINVAVKKLPAPDFIRVDHNLDHQWVVSVPVFTDIDDSAFIERARAAIEDEWHVRDGDDDFRVALDVRRVSPADLYPNGDVPLKGAHIDVGAHVARFPPGGVVLTTGGNSTYALGRGIILGPHAIVQGVVVHEFGHMLGFRDGYFRSYQDLGTDGYGVPEVILASEKIVAVPENGRVTREHFEQLIREKSR
jgi:hypothetical protein